jgi:O-antigen/teichoic acid export membrane protein
MESLFGTLEAAQRFELVNGVKVPFYLSSALAPVLGTALGVGLAGIAWMLVAAVGTILVVLSVMCARVFPALRRAPRFHRAEVRELFGFAGWVMVSNAVNPLLTYVERLAIGAIVAIGAVTHYTAPSEVVMRLSLVALCLSDTLFPAFSTLSGQGRVDLLREYASRAVRYLLLVLGPLVVLAVAYAPAILEAWLGPTFPAESALVLRILAIGVLANSIASVPYALVQARGRPDVTAKLHLIELPIHAIAVLVLVSTAGIVGAALAWTLRVVLDAVLLFVATSRLGVLEPGALARGRFASAAFALAVPVIAAIGIAALPLPEWAELAVPVLGGAGAALAAWAFLLDEDDRAHALRAVGLRRAS